MTPNAHTPSDDTLRQALRAHPYHDLPPVPEAYPFRPPFDGWHRDRMSLTGLRVEAIKFVKSFGANSRPKKLVVYGRPRSGTTLLGKLLGQVSGVFDAGEYLHFGMLAPIRALDNHARSCGADVFVAKLLTYQLLEVQKIRDPLGFFRQLEDRDYQFLHIRRDTYDQALSLCTARAAQRYFTTDRTGAPVERQEIEIDPAAFEAQIRRSLAMLDFEDQLMAAVPHLAVQYGTDLRPQEAHQPTVDRICAALGVPSAPVAAKMKRTGGAQGHHTLLNEDALHAHLRQVGLDHVIPPARS